MAVTVLKIWKKIDDRAPVNLPPGPWKFPIVGNIPQLIGRGLPHERLRDLANIYGPVMSIQQGQIPSIVISSSETAKQVLKTQGEIFAGRPHLLAGEIICYNSMDIFFTSYGDYWRQMKNISTLELLSAKRVHSSRFRSVREEEVSKFMDFIRSKSGSPLNIKQSMSDLINRIMMKMTVGENGGIDEILLAKLDDVQEVIVNSLFSDLFPSLKFLEFVTGEKSRMVKVHREIDKIIEEIISEHKTKGKSNNGDNLLDAMLELQKNGELQIPLTDESIKANILEMFVSGSETTSKVIKWSLAELMKNPEMMRKAQEEVHQIFGGNGKIDESRLQELNYLKLVIKETFRFHPPTTLFIRKCEEKSKIDGYDIFPETTILINVWAISRDPEVWVHAEKFCPERFQDGQFDYKGAHMEFIPFGGGKRICPGISLATTIIELFLANLLYHFDWKLLDGITPKTLDMSGKSNQGLYLIPIPHSLSLAKVN